MLKSSPDPDFVKQLAADFNVPTGACVAPDSASSDGTVYYEYGPEQAAKLDAVLDSFNRLIESLSTELDEATNDDHSNEVAPRADDVTNVDRECPISSGKEKPTRRSGSATGLCCQSGVDKQSCQQTDDNGRLDNASCAENRQRKSRNNDVASEHLREESLPCKFPGKQEDSTAVVNYAKRSPRRKISMPPLYNSPVEHTGTSFSGKSLEAEGVEGDLRLVSDSVNDSGSRTNGEDDCARTSVASQATSPRSKSFSFVAEFQVLSNLDEAQGGQRGVGGVGAHRERGSQQGAKKHRKSGLDRIESFFAPQASPTDPQGADSSNKQSNRLSNLTSSAPFRFAQQIFTGHKEKRKLSSTKSLPVHSNSNFGTSLDASQRVSHRTSSPPDLSNVISGAEKLAPQPSKPPSGLAGTDFGTWSKRKFKNKALKLNFRRASSLEEYNKNLCVTPGSTGTPDSPPYDLLCGGKSLVTSRTSRDSPTSSHTSSRFTPFEVLFQSPGSLFRSSDRKKQQQNSASPKPATKSDSADMSGESLNRSRTDGYFRYDEARSFDSNEQDDSDCRTQGSHRASPSFYFTDDCTEVPTRRATMDSAQRPTNLFLHSSGGRSKNDQTDLASSVVCASSTLQTSHSYSSLPRSGAYGVRMRRDNNRSPHVAASVAWLAPGDGVRSDGSSEENTTERRPRANVHRHFSDRVVAKRQEAFDSGDQQHQPPRVSRGKKGKIKKFRKSLKHVGKTTSSPYCDVTDGMAERTWGPEGNCTWSNMSGRKTQLGWTRLQTLSELECDALQKVAQQRLSETDLDVTIVVPKDNSKSLNRKISMKKRYAVLSARDKSKDKGADRVFGIPLVEAVENDQLLRLQAFASPQEYAQPSEGKLQNDVSPRTPGQQDGSLSSSCSDSSTSINNHQGSQGEGDKPLRRRGLLRSSSCESIHTFSVRTPTDLDSVFPSPVDSNHAQDPSANHSPPSANNQSSSAAKPLKRRGAIAADSINEIDPYQSQLLEALSLSVSGKTGSHRREKKRSLLPPTMAQVPYVVQKCCDHITKYGLDVTGIFRVAGSKKRVKQLREEFDRGVDVTIDEDYNPHDVAALLKEFFRDLPEALLTRELYPAFVQTARLPKTERLTPLRSLLWLLPLTNRDTLHTLLNFLAVVAAHSEPSIDATGHELAGNKMGVSNLATIFGPNILHRYKNSIQSGTENHYQVQPLEKVEDSSAVITVVEEIITNHVQLFQIPQHDHDQMLRTLNETDPEAVDFLLRRKAANYMREKAKPFNQNAANHSTNNNNSSGVLSHHTHDDLREDCRSCERDLDNRKEDASPRLQGSMRLSYQQATGHVFPPSPVEPREKESKLKFMRPFFKRSNPPSAHVSDSDELNESSQESERETTEQTASEAKIERNGSSAKSADESPEQQCADATKDSSASSCSLKLHQKRSMSFTEDEMHAILKPSSLQQKSSQTLSALARDLNDMATVHEESPHGGDLEQMTHRNKFEKNNREPTVDAHGSRSSDSGVDIVSPDFGERRYGFSVKLPASSGRDAYAEDALRSSRDVIVTNDATSSITDSIPSSDDSIEMTSSSSTRLLKSRASPDQSPAARQRFVGDRVTKQTFQSTTSIKFSNLSTGNTNNSNNVRTAAAGGGRGRRNSQVLRLCAQDKNNLSLLRVNDNDRLNEINSSSPTASDQAPRSPRRRRLPSSLSPRVRRQYGGAYENEARPHVREQRQEVISNKVKCPTESEDSPSNGLHAVGDKFREVRGRCVNDSTLGQRHREDAFLRKHAANYDHPKPAPSYPSHRSCEPIVTTRGAPNSAYVTREHCRDRACDAKVAEDSRHFANQSRWTSSGYVFPITEKTSRARIEQSVWKSEQETLPETWV